MHILLLLATAPGGQLTSGRLAESVGTNPVVIRRLAGQLARAGLIRIRRGPGGAELAKAAELITLGQIWQAMRRKGLPLLPVHRGPNRAEAAPAAAIPTLLREVFDSAEAAMEADLASVTLAELRARMEAPAEAQREVQAT
ncbi:Rrf2 family transcriptional regulator [Roseomonas sp. BU-1]|uniref:Rrf2 family transcriptional regulator n=1 Tax=Falsiroseomonas selenitidurans TaxID=2716335 RepID=A0ABX1E3V1_9PROT|nr:Rrf2 family transcriptional regulator [Falsiroseomonas selenitidurans]